MECISGSSTFETPAGGELEATKQDEVKLNSSGGTAHSEAVLALRKHLLRKISSDEGSGEKEGENVPEGVISITESNGSKFCCQLLQRFGPRKDDQSKSTQGNKKTLTKHQSLDLKNGTTVSELRYLRTDLCVPVLWSKCSFCGLFFESEEELRKHLRDYHFQYFLNYEQLRPQTTTKSLNDLPFSSALKIQDPPPPPPPTPNLQYTLSAFRREMDENQELFMGRFCGTNKKPVTCKVCGKSFSSKWNFKQHAKGHAKEMDTNEDPQMETDAA